MVMLESEKAADLIHAIGNLEQTIDGVELGLAPEAGVDSGRRILLKELVEVGIGRVGGRCNETSVGIFEVLAVVEGQLRQNGAVGGRYLWFGGHRRLSIARALYQADGKC